MRAYTGRENSSKDPAQDELDHIELPINGIKENDRIYLIYYKNQLSGYCKYYEGFISSDTIFLGFLGIIPKFQNQKIGQKVYNLLENEFKNKHFSNIRINVGSKNIIALSFWIKNNFKSIISYFKYENGFLDINLEKAL